MSPFDSLIARAFRQGPAPDANLLIHEVRGEVQAVFGLAVNYEAMLDGRGWSHVLEVVAPRLALYLRSKRLRVTSCDGAFLSLFLDGTLYFVAAPDFYAVVRQAQGWSEEAFAALAAGWEQTGRAAIAALPAAAAEEPSS